MKCPKCDYLGFETGDRCRNCGYDFSLMTDSMVRDADLVLREPDSVSGPNDWLKQLDRDVELNPPATPEPAPGPLQPLPLASVASAPTSVAVEAPRAAPRRVAPSLPLFQPGSLDDDQPLIRMPAAPRAPLAVRRTPDTPRLRAVSKPARRPVADVPTMLAPDHEPVLDFHDQPAPDASSHIRMPAVSRRTQASDTVAETGSPRRRLAAAALDHAILFGVDAVVIYLTLQIAALTIADWRALPVLPLLAFLGMVKAAYFCAFTLVGGQTIGKMAARLRVVMLDGSELDPPGAVRRTLAGALSLASFGLTFVPVLFSMDRRALHDHIARTRVIALR